MGDLSPWSEKDFSEDEMEVEMGSPWSNWSSPSSFMRCGFECPVCSRSTEDTPFLFPIELLCCKAQICRECLVQSVSLNQRRCPLAYGEQVHMLHDIDVFAGCINTTSWFKEEQDRIWKDGGCTGFKCGEDACIGVIKPRHTQTVQSEACPRCNKKYCARCKVPWLSDQHRCEDLRLRDEERREAHDEELRREAARQWRNEQLRAMEERAAAMVLRARRARRCSIRGLVGFLIETMSGQRDHTFNAEVRQAMHQIRARRPIRHLQNMEADDNIPDMVYGDNVSGRPYELQYRPCPTCDTMVERINGCNMIQCPNCPFEFCFACGRDETHGCKHFLCALRTESMDVASDEVTEHLDPLARHRRRR